MSCVLSTDVECRCGTTQQFGTATLVIPVTHLCPRMMLVGILQEKGGGEGDKDKAMEVEAMRMEGKATYLGRLASLK